MDNEEQIKLFVSSHRDSCSDSKEILMMHYLVLKNKVMERVNL